MKIVVNKCFGGYGLSNAALLRLYAEGSKAVSAYEPRDYYGGREGWEADFERDVAHKETRPHHLCISPDGKILTKEYGDDVRTDQILIRVVEEMGKGANSWASDLRVIEIPDGIEYDIEDYDGIETVVERGHSW